MTDHRQLLDQAVADMERASDLQTYASALIEAEYASTILNRTETGT